MRRPRFRKSVTNISLFPFLAVLICTMGALIVLLVMVVQQARLQADEQARTDVASPPSTEAMAAEDYQWKFDLLEQQRDAMAREVADRLAELSHLENHLRELEEQWKQLKLQAEQFERLRRSEVVDRQQLGEQQAQLAAEIERARRELEEAQQRAAARPRTYAIVPYQGSQGTFRRPVFVECRPEGLVIQPEGVLITAEDFGGLVGPGNPLDAALRGARAHMAAAGLSGEAYPLLVVRPGGAEAYALARAALKTWDNEFGYELIEDQVQLKYPPRDEQLAELLKKAVVDSRRRQEALAAAMPAVYGGNGSLSYVASRRGGFVAVAGDGERAINRVGGFGQGADERLSDGGPGKPSEAPVEDQGPSAANVNRPGSSYNSNSPNAQMDGVQPGGLAGQRGQNWGLPNSSANATGITRPIRVACAHDRLIILPDKGDREFQPQVVPLPGPLHLHVDLFVNKIWKVMEGWGIAVVGGYWKPVLNVEVAPGGERRFLELQAALRDSGLDIVRTSR